MKALGLLISPARWNQLMGSQHTVAPVCRCRPSGTPVIGDPLPIAKGHSPHTCTVVPRHISGGWRYGDDPPPRPPQPLLGGCVAGGSPPDRLCRRRRPDRSASVVSAPNG